MVEARKKSSASPKGKRGGAGGDKDGKKQEDKKNKKDDAVSIKTEKKPVTTGREHSNGDSKRETVAKDRDVKAEGMAVNKSMNEKSSSVSAEDIQMVQNLIERCLQLYLTQEEVVSVLREQAAIDAEFTQLIWSKLEEQNPDFFRCYYTRLKLKAQIVMFNHLLEQQVAVVQKMQRGWNMNHGSSTASGIPLFQGGGGGVSGDGMGSVLNHMPFQSMSATPHRMNPWEDASNYRNAQSRFGGFSADPGMNIFSAENIGPSPLSFNPISADFGEFGGGTNLMHGSSPTRETQNDGLRRNFSLSDFEMVDTGNRDSLNDSGPKS
jgi:uncharacterized protein (TIGR01589 family)